MAMPSGSIHSSFSKSGTEAGGVTVPPVCVNESAAGKAMSASGTWVGGPPVMVRDSTSTPAPVSVRARLRPPVYERKSTAADEASASDLEVGPPVRVYDSASVPVAVSTKDFAIVLIVYEIASVPEPVSASVIWVTVAADVVTLRGDESAPRTPPLS